MRAKYTSEEQALEENVYTIHEQGTNQAKPRHSLYRQYVALPTELPRLDGYDAENFYTINLDAEVLTMNHALHWRLDSIPRADKQWLRAITRSAYQYVPTVKPDLCPEACMASLAVPLPDSDKTLRGVSELVVRDARTQLDTHDKVWRALVAADLWTVHCREIGRFGRQWYPRDLPFRELAFALVSLASGLAAFRSFRSKPDGLVCSPRHCKNWACDRKHLHADPGWVGQEWLVGGDKAQPSLLAFCSPTHRPGLPPGAAPLETTYWLTDDVLVCLTLVTDGVAVTGAMRWGIEQLRGKRSSHDDKEHMDGRHTPEGNGEEDRRRRGEAGVRFYMVVLSLFEVLLAEVFQPATASGEEESEPTIVASFGHPLSPLDEALCLSTHPRERPVLRADQERYLTMPHESINPDSYKQSVRTLRRDFPGIAAMVNFFSAVASRRAATGGALPNGRLPLELYAHILDLVDYATWQSCLAVSSDIRALCLARYRLDDRTAIVGGPSTISDLYRGDQVMAFELRDLHTGKTERAMRMRNDGFIQDYNWMPLIGSGDRQALVLDVNLLFESYPKAVERKKDWDNRRSAAAEKAAAEKAAAEKAAAEKAAAETA